MSTSVVVISPEVEKTYTQAKIGLMSRIDSAFFTTVLFSLKFEWVDEISTAATDGRVILVNPVFFYSLDSEERIFVLVHEAMHVAYMHPARLKDRDPRRWNIACDHYINLSLIERGFKMPKNGLADPKYKGLNPDEIYKLLPEDINQDFEMDLKEFTGDLGELEKDIEDILVRAAIQSQSNGDKAGTIPGDIQIFLDKLLNPKLPWQKVMQKYMRTFNKSNYTWRKPNRRYQPDHYLPSLTGQRLMDLAIAVDASGSVTDENFKSFISEISGIFRMLKPKKITLVTFDSGIRGVDEIQSFRDLMNVRFTGRGGTRIGPVIEWANENRPQLLLVFSDGEFNFYGQETQSQTLWIIHNNESFGAPFGKVIHYHMEE